jgi:hypothetical protein
VLLQSTSPARTKFRVRGRVGNLPPFDLPLAGPIVAQLQATNGQCWEATFGGEGVRRNDAEQFQAMSD